MICTMAVKRPLNVLFMTRRFPPSVGGMEKFAYDLHNSLKVKARVRLIKWGGSNKYIPVILMPVFFLRACWVLITQRVDVIHVQDGVFSILGVALKFIFRKPLTVVIHGLDITHEGKLYKFLIPKALKRADHIFCISNVAMEEVIRRGIDKNKVSFVPLGITDDLNLVDKAASKQRVLQKLAVPSSSKLILSTGRLVRRKGVDWFIESVLPELIQENSSIYFIVSGTGPELETIEQTIKRQKVEANIRLLGRTSDEFLRDLYNGSDIFVMPNIKVPGDMEGFGLVLLEAALCELPIVATGIEGITDAIIDGQNGILVGEKDTTSFTLEIRSLLSVPAKAHQLGNKARQFTLKNFSWDKIAQAYTDEYQKLLG